MAAGKVRMRNVLEVAERIWIVKCPVFSKTFPVISPLKAMQIAIWTKIGAVNEFTLTIEVQPPGVAAALTKKLELMRQCMISPFSLMDFQSTNRSEEHTS